MVKILYYAIYILSGEYPMRFDESFKRKAGLGSVARQSR